MPTTPTTEGSIVAYIKADNGDLNRGIDAARAKVAELTTADTTVRVKADVASAVTKLSAVEVAQRRVNDAMSKADTAYARAALAQQRLDDVSSKRGRTEYQVAAATLANTEAQKRLNAANEKVILSESVLADAQRKVAEAAVAEAAAQEVSTNAKVKANQANLTTASRMGLIIAAVALLIPLLAPLTGYAVGVAGALAGMGAAGVLAILGIKNAMAQGTAAGNTFSAGLQILKGDLAQLERTASNAMLPGFTNAISVINENMPELNREIGLFSTQLGTVGNIVLQATVNAFRVLNPLFLTAGVYVEQLAVGFQKWTQDGGLQKFGNYAISVLPQVAQTLGSLSMAAINLVTALAPVGSVVLDALTAFGGFISFLSSAGPVFAVVVSGATAALLAFKAWGLIAPMLASLTEAAALATNSITLLGVSMKIATGPIGWIIAAIAAVATGFAVASAANDNATRSMQDYTAAVQEDNGVVGKNVQAQAAKALQDANALNTAKQLGISTRDVTKAALNEGDAHERLTAKLKEMVRVGTTVTAYAKGRQVTMTDEAKSAKTLLDAINSTSGGIKEQIKAYNAIADAQGLTSISTKEQLVAQTALAAKYGMSLPAYLAAIGGQKQTSDQLKITTHDMQLQNDAAGLLKNALDKLNGKAISAADAQNAFDSSLTNMGDHITATGKKITFTTTNIGDMSSASVSLRGQLNGQISALQGVVEANGGLANSTGKAHDQMVTMRQQIIDNAVAHGVDRDAVTQYIDKILSIPKTVPPTKLDIDTSLAMSKLDAYNRAVASVQATAGTAAAFKALADANASLGRAAGHADGGPIYRAAGGPIEAAYLASGGNPFAPRGTDTIPAMLTMGEFVVRQSAASYDPQFLKAYNQNPQKALQSVASQAPQAPSIHFGDVIQQPNTSMAETMQAAGWFARAFTS